MSPVDHYTERDDLHRRRVRVPVAHPIFLEIMTQGWIGNGLHCIQGLPPGAKDLSASYDIHSDTWWLEFCHPDFDPVNRGDDPPIFSVVFERRGPVCTQ